MINIKIPIIDEKTINNAQSTNAMKELIRLMRNREDQKNFKVGDVLVCKNIHKNAYVKNNSVIKKWIVSYVDNYKLIYAYRILSNGKISKKLTCLTISLMSEKLKYDIDPNHIELVLLDNEEAYDPADEIRETNRIKNIVRNINRDKRLTKEDFDKLTPQDKVWHSSDYQGTYTVELWVTNISNVKSTNHAIITVQSKDSFGKFKANKRKITRDSISMFFKERPITIEDMI